LDSKETGGQFKVILFSFKQAHQTLELKQKKKRTLKKILAYHYMLAGAKTLIVENLSES